MAAMPFEQHAAHSHEPRRIEPGDGPVASADDLEGVGDGGPAADHHDGSVDGRPGAVRRKIVGDGTLHKYRLCPCGH